MQVCPVYRHSQVHSMTHQNQLFESEMRSVVIEAQTREEVMTEMDDRMKKMEAMFTRRLMQEVCLFFIQPSMYAYARDDKGRAIRDEDGCED
jgi:hypothetical protein